MILGIWVTSSLQFVTSVLLSLLSCDDIIYLLGLKAHLMYMTPILIFELPPELQVPISNCLLGRSLPRGTSYTMDKLTRISSTWSDLYLD